MALLTLQFVTNIPDLEYDVVEFNGELDQSTLPSAEKQVDDFIERLDRSYLIFDFSNLKYTSSEGIAFIVTTNTKLTKKGKQLLLANVPSNVGEVFTVTGLGKIIPTFHAMADAISYMVKK